MRNPLKNRGTKSRWTMKLRVLGSTSVIWAFPARRGLLFDPKLLASVWFRIPKTESNFYWVAIKELNFFYYNHETLLQYLLFYTHVLVASCRFLIDSNTVYRHQCKSSKFDLSPKGPTCWDETGQGLGLKESQGFWFLVRKGEGV